MSKSKKKAVALKYNAEEDIAPLVVASGYGDVADRIIDIAEQRGIPVFRDDSAASMMCMLQVGTAIPEELYQVVAAIYVQLLSISAEMKGITLPAIEPQKSSKPAPAKPEETTEKPEEIPIQQEQEMQEAVPGDEI